MKLKYRNRNGWLYCAPEKEPKHSIYKLHVALPVAHYDAYFMSLYECLKQGVEEGIIAGFKILNEGSSETLKAMGGDAKGTTETQPELRLLNNPGTIYLHESPDLEKVAAFGKKLGAILRNAPGCNPDHLSRADIQVTERLSFRQANLKGQYVAINSADAATLEQLRKEAEESKEFSALKKHLQATDAKQEAKDDKIALSERERFIHQFYDKNFKYYEKELKSPNLETQIRVACSLMNIDYESLIQKNSEKEWLAIINPKFKQASLQFHPDKVSNPEVQAKAKQIFQLVNEANGVLKKVAANPGLLTPEKPLKQQAHIPRHQYELEEYEDDPYYYKGMAKDDRQIMLVQNWETMTVPGDNKSDRQQSTAVQAFQPQVVEYKGSQKKMVPKPGYEAFYLLFMAGALPNRFDQGHFEMIFLDEDGGFTLATAWLVKKALTTPEMIGFMDSRALCRLAQRATKHKILDIGNDDVAVFLYYYKNFPETLYGRRLVKFFELKKFDVERAVTEILKEPQKLQLLSASVLIELIRHSNRLRQYVLQNKELALRLGSYALDDILKPVFAEAKCDEFTQTAIRQWVWGNFAFLHFLSEKKLAAIKVLLQANLPEMAPWLNEEIDRELLYRKNGAVAENALGRELICQSYQFENPRKYIKQHFIQAPVEIANSLNAKTLAWLIDQPETHWTYYLILAKALIDLNKKEFAHNLLLRVAAELRLNATNLSLEQLIIKIEAQQAAINAANAQWQREQVADLSARYQKALDGVSDESASHIRDCLEMFKAEKLAAEAFKKNKARLEGRFNDLVQNRLMKGEATPQLKREFAELKQEYLRGGHDKWPSREYLDSDIFVIMQTVMGVKDSFSRMFGDTSGRFAAWNMDASCQDVMKNLERLFYVYECLDDAAKFYRVLASFTQLAGQEPFANLVHFDKDAIKKHLLNFWANEIAVYVCDKRENAPYKTARFHDFQNIQSIADIHATYKRLGAEEQFNALIMAAFHELYANFVETENVAHLKKYQEIRAECGLVSPAMEALLVDEDKRKVAQDTQPKLGTMGKIRQMLAAPKGSSPVEKKDTMPAVHSNSVVTNALLLKQTGQVQKADEKNEGKKAILLANFVAELMQELDKLPKHRNNPVTGKIFKVKAEHRDTRDHLMGDLKKYQKISEKNVDQAAGEIAALIKAYHKAISNKDAKKSRYVKSLQDFCGQRNLVPENLNGEQIINCCMQVKNRLA